MSRWWIGPTAMLTGLIMVMALVLVVEGVTALPLVILFGGALGFPCVVRLAMGK